MQFISTDYPDIIEIAIFPMIISIFAIAFPLLLQTVSRIDDKYNSTKLVELFRTESICNCYIITLIATIIFYIIWMLQLPRVFDFDLLNWFIDNSALICIVITTLALIIQTIIIANITYTYYHPLKLFKRLQRKHNKSKNKKEKYFVGISNILFYSIQKNDEDLNRQLLEFYFDAFIAYRKNKKGQIVEYPQGYYNSVFAANELFYQSGKRTISSLNDGTLFELFLDEYQHTIISPKTYEFIWMCLLQVLHYNRDEFVMAYWRKAHQLFNLFLKPAEKKYDELFNIINQDEISKREKERESFLELHYALGGLLMYLKKYELLREIIYWTNQDPPKYVLVPERMEEVIQRYMEVSKKGGYINPIYYVQRYPFPNISGVKADGIIQMWIKRYLSVLFLRQYTIQSYYMYSNPLNIPTPPDNLSEMKYWNDELDSLIYFVEESLKNKKLLKALELREMASPDWFEQNQKEKPTDLINKLIKEIDRKFEDKKKNQDIDPNRLNEFKKNTIKIISNTLDLYSRLFYGNINSEYKSIFISGRYQVMEKAGFAINQEVGYADFDTIVAKAVSLEFENISINAFALMRHKKYILKEEDMFKAIDKLDLDSSKNVIVAIGVNMDYFSMSNVSGLLFDGENWSYNKIKIISINNQMNALVRQSFFILKEQDLPSMVYNKISDEIVMKFKLKIIDDSKSIYANILDLNKPENQAIRDEIPNVNTNDLSKLVLVCIGINTEIRYRVNTNCIQLKIFSQFEDRGTVNILSDVQPVQ